MMRLSEVPVWSFSRIRVSHERVCVSIGSPRAADPIARIGGMRALAGSWFHISIANSSIVVCVCGVEYGGKSSLRCVSAANQLE